MEDAEIIKIYNEEYIGQHIGGYKLRKKYNYNFYPDFKRLNLPMRNNQEKNRKYYCDEDYFDTIDSEEKAYWLGFIFADGFISQGNGNHKDIKKFGMSLQINDIGHLKKFQKAVDTDNPIHEYKVTKGYKIGSGYCRIVISNATFANNLMKHGCVEHKTDILKPPIGVPKELEKHFIRGYLDGDGCIAVNAGTNTPSYTIKFVSTEDVLLWIMHHLIDNNILEHEYKFYKRREEQIASSFEFGGNYLSKKFLDYIYQDATIWLDRKYDRYINLVNLIESKECKSAG